MRWTVPSGCVCGIFVATIGVATLGAQQARPAVLGASARPATAAVVITPAHFAGVWDYNDDESINVVTGKPEQGTDRDALRVTPRPSSDNSVATLRNRDIDMRNSGGLRPTPEMVRETQDLSRDLLEVPERLTIAIGPSAVTITDDLDRERAYPTDGTTRQMRLGASQFEAGMTWQGEQLRKDVEGRYGFRMTEIYFLSPDARRLFVIVRVGDPKKGFAQAGFNRVYDRVDP